MNKKRAEVKNCGLSCSIQSSSTDMQNVTLKVHNGNKHALINLLDACQGLASMLPGNVYLKDSHSNYLWCNNQFANLLKFDHPVQIVGKNDYNFLDAEAARKIIANDLHVIQQGETLYAEEWFVNTEGIPTPYMTSKIPIYGEQNEIIGLLGVSIDITDRKKIERLQLEKLQIEKQTVEQMAHALEMLSGSIAHDIKTPLAVIGINVDNLRLALQQLLASNSTISLGNNLMSYLDNIKHAINNADCIISMLLVKLRNSCQQVDEREEFLPVTIKKSVVAAICEYPYRGRERDLIIWDNVANPDFTYVGSNLLTKHVLFNLMKNAFRAIRGVDKGKIDISLRVGKGKNCLVFKDTASGMSSAKLKSIFKLFNGDMLDAGAGLGLVFCKKTMRAYGGDITCDSQEGKYTKFTLSFPPSQNIQGDK